MKIFKITLVFLPFIQLLAEDISVVKNGALHTFVQPPETEYFTRNLFQNWEQETFQVFEKVKDSEGIAIDLGAWIGTTSIWLSKNFYHVISVEADYKSVESLSQNLSKSNCSNVSICNRPISEIAKIVIFGPSGGRGGLNESLSTIKTQSNSQLDYPVKAITLKQKT